MGKGRKITDLTGQKFGGLTVIKRAEDYVSPSGQHCPQWLCKCDCGNEVAVRSASLKRGTKSCGCARGRVRSENAGVSYISRINKWVVNIRVGSFNNHDDAIKACENARNLLFSAEE